MKTRHSIASLVTFALVLSGFEAPSAGVLAAGSEPRAAAVVADDLEVALDHLRDASKAITHSSEALGNSVDYARLQELMVALSELNTQVGTWNRTITIAKSNTEMAAVHTARSLASVWVDDVRALGEGAAARREAALAKMRSALQGQDEEEQMAALMAVAQVGDVEYDKASLRPLVLPFVSSSVGPMLPKALYALRNTKIEEGDLELVHAAWERDRLALSDSILHLLQLFGSGRLEGRSEEIALVALAGYEQRGDNVSINGLWGARVGPLLEARVLELARNDNHEVRHGAIYFGLSTFTDKSPAVVDALIEALVDPDFNNSGRALWGLGRGVPTELQPRVVDALVELHNARSSPSVRSDCRRLVAQYGGEAGLARLAQ